MRGMKTYTDALHLPVVLAEAGGVLPSTNGEPMPATLESTTDHHRVSAFDLVASQPWAILPGMLETISAIARRQNESVDALEARMGRPLQNTRSVTVRDGVAVVPVVGPVFRYANLFTDISGATSLDVLAREFAQADADPAVKSIVLNFNTPGGQASGISEFAALVRGASKPVVAFVEQAASAGYWMASAASEIVIGSTGEAGSVGAVFSIDTSRSRGSVVEIVSSQSPKKRPDVNTPEGRSQLQVRADKWAQAFIDDVAVGRKVSVEHVLAHFGQGDMRMGMEAVDAGMADRMATLEEVIAGLSGKSVKGAIMANEAGAPEAQTPAIDRVYLAANHPDLVTALQAEGATAERERILGVQAQGAKLPGHDKLIAALVADGTSTAADAAMQILTAEQAIAGQRREALQADRLNPVHFAAAPSASEDAALDTAAAADADANLPVETRCENQWKKDASLHREFTSLSAYTAYTKATESGRARVLAKN